MTNRVLQKASVIAVLLGHEAKGIAKGKALLTAAVTALAPALVYGWLANRINTPTSQLHLAYGAGIFAMWTGYLFRVSYLLYLEDMLGTLDTIRLSSSSIFLVTYSKCWGLLIISMPRGIVAVAITLTMIDSDRGFAHPNFWLAVLLLLISLQAVALLLSPLRIYVAVREGALNSLIPATAILSAVLFPADRMPDILYWVSIILPIRWAMEALTAAAIGKPMVGPATTAAGLIVLYYLSAVIIYQRVEKRYAHE
ncbi:MAG: ABC transporter permease [bacterium]|nr:ABC transporter permease [bacterium]